jgi:PAS domain S-box-containing protein
MNNAGYGQGLSPANKPAETIILLAIGRNALSLLEIFVKGRLIMSVNQNDTELHRTILNNISDAVFMTEETGKFTFVCPNSHVIFGFTDEEIGKFDNINKLLGPQIDEFRNFKKSEIKNIEISISDKNKKKHILLINIKKIHINESRLLYTCRDITEKTQLHEELYNKKKTLDILIEKAPIGIVTSDLAGNYLSTNKVFSDIVGYSKDELLKMKEPMLVHFNSIEKANEMRARVISNRNANFIYDLTYTDNTGFEKYIHANSILITDKNDTPLFVLSIIEDITKIKLQHEKKERLISLLQKNYNGISEIISLANELSSDEVENENDELTERLTEKEKQVLFFISEGNSIRTIANKLSVAEVTVKKHISSIYRKYGVNNRIELINKTREKSHS